MSDTILSEFNPDARIWIYGFTHSLNRRQSDTVHEIFKRFIAGWFSHGNKVAGAYTLLNDRFLVLCISQQSVISGCSIGASVNVLKDLHRDHALDALNVDLIYFKSDDAIQIASRYELQNLYDQGVIDDNTIVFDTAIETLGDLRNGFFEKRIKHSWHRTLIRKAS